MGAIPGFSFILLPAPIMPSQGWGAAVCSPCAWSRSGTRRDVQSSSLLRLALCKLRQILTEAGPKLEGFLLLERVHCLPPTIPQCTDQSPWCGYSCVYTTSASVALPKAGRRKGGVIFHFFKNCFPQGFISAQVSSFIAIFETLGKLQANFLGEGRLEDTQFLHPIPK